MRSSRRLEFTEEAEVDLRSLLEYTLTIWGEEQQDRYADRLMHVLRGLLAQPSLGPLRDDIAPELRNLHVGQHVAYYRVLETSIRIERILHMKMDPSRHLRDHW
jgi:toxin ParE1/3/4